MESLRKKLGVLREAQRGLQEDIRANAQLGEEVSRTSSFTLKSPSGQAVVHSNAPPPPLVDTPVVNVRERNRETLDS